LAKLAADNAKHDPAGVLALVSGVDRAALLGRAPVSDVWGVGPRKSAFLRRHGIETAAQLARADLGWLRRHLSVVSARTALELRGVSCLPLEEARGPKKQICTSRSLGHEVRELGELREAVATFASNVAAKARAQRTAARTVTVFLNTHPFRTGEKQYHPSCVVTLPAATNDTRDLVHAALQGLERIYQAGYRYHKAGVVVGHFVSDAYRQAALWEEPPAPERDALMRTIDAINARWGRETIRLAATGTNTTRAWRQQQSNRSPRYTTRWHELAEAH
jgi:DNA polymerase V